MQTWPHDHFKQNEYHAQAKEQPAGDLHIKGRFFYTSLDEIFNLPAMRVVHCISLGASRAPRPLPFHEKISHSWWMTKCRDLIADQF